MTDIDGSGRRRPKVLSPETKWEIFLQITTGEITQADAARHFAVDVSTIIGIRRTVKSASLAALSAKPGRPTKQRDWRLEAAHAEIAQLTEAVKSQAIELAVMRGKAGGGAGRDRPADPLHGGPLHDVDHRADPALRSLVADPAQGPQALAGPVDSRSMVG